MENESITKPKPKRRVRFFTVFLFIVLILAGVFGFNFKTAVVDGQSMNPTLSNGQKVLTTKAYFLVGAIKKNDIIVLQEEQSASKYFIKRVYGMPGDQIPWALAPQDWPLENGPYTVPAGRIYVIGDNILHSDDSRKFGAFKLENVLGKVVTWR
ncbi:MAG: signal peptidase I [Armatimonadota bacterium]